MKPGGGGVTLWVKISRGARLEVQNGTPQDLNEIIDLGFGQFWGQKDRLHAENGGFRNGTQQDLNKMLDMVKILGVGTEIVQMPKMGGKTAAHTYWLSKRECPPPPEMKRGTSSMCLLIHVPANQPNGHMTQ